jgi:hypothetical protein
LLSVDGLGLKASQSIWAFHIETWGVEFLGVCYVPPSWQLKSEKFENPEGYLDGRSDTHGVALRRLPEMYLVDVYDYQPLPKGDPKAEYHPASFAGWVAVGRVQPFGEDGPHQKRKLTAGNFRLRDAAHCPNPPPAQP